MLRALAAIAVLVLAAAAVLIVGTYTFLPPMVEGVAAREIGQRLDLETDPKVDLSSDPPPSMLAGRFSGGSVVLGDLDLDGVRAEGVSVDLDPFRVDVPASLRAGALKREEPLSGALEAEIPEAEVARLVRERSEAEVPVSDVRVEPGAVSVGSEVSVLGTSVPASARGPVSLRGGELVFEPREVEALGLTVPQDLADQFLSEVDFSYPLGDLPYGAEVTDIRAERGRLVLSGRAERIPVG